MLAKFKKQSLLIKILLLVIPFVSFIKEVVLRWSNFLKKGNLLSLVIAIVVTFTSWLPFIGWVDALWIFLNNKLILE